jgi:hypothetical protein
LIPNKALLFLIPNKALLPLKGVGKQQRQMSEARGNTAVATKKLTKHTAIS